jgi:predicted ATPase/signal transduction histidine kinase
MMIVSGYDVGAQLYDGPSSQIYRARRRAGGLPVILKLLKPAYPSPERLAWFKQEYERLRSLDLPGVVKVHGLECDQHRWVMVLEDFGGESLDQTIARSDRSLEELLTLAIAIADALGAVHQHNIIHKDINPSNIVWNPADGALKLIDFGISTVLPRESPSLRSPEVLQGTLAYISPEQTGRMNRAVDYRTDFYSLGVTLYQLFTGQLPFQSDDAMELIHRHIARQPAPPHERSPSVPKALSDVIMKLMGKTAESRYQSSFGIKADLTECLVGLRERGAVPSFAPGRLDVPERFQLPQKLYGRESEVEGLLAAFERVAGHGDSSQGQPELVLLAGPSGIGKTVLVQELYRPITRRRGYFASGKFEQFQGSTPYSGIAVAFRSLVRQLLCESEERLARWREELRAALGPSAQVLLDVLPEVELIIGPQQPVQPLGPTEAQNRFDRVFLGFIRVLARAPHPLVLFLDDLQRADPGSLRLLELLFADDEVQHLLVLGAYRDNEVGPAHPLRLALDALMRLGATLHIRLGPLRLHHIVELVADTVAGDDAAVQLAELLVRKTDGNPLFVSEFLKEIHREGLLSFDRSEGRWRSDLARIEAKAITDNVVDLMIDKLRRLPEATQAALRLAACIGGSFDLQTLSLVDERSPAETFARLLPALEEGFVLAASELTVVASEAAESPLLVRDYRFLHDRVQQAAYALSDDDQKKALHLRLARLLLASTPGPDRGEKVFALADQFNRAGALVSDGAERAAVAELNLSAGRRARAALAYAAARDYLAAGARALGEGGWTRHPELALDLHRELADAEHLNGQHERAEALARLCLERAGTAMEKAEVSTMLVSHHTMLGRYDDAIKTARHGLSLLGVDLPADGLEAAMGAAFAGVQAKRGRMAGREIASLLDRPEMVDPWAKTATKLLLKVLPSAFYVSPVLYSVVIFKAVDLSLEYGHPPESCDLYSYYGHLLSGIYGEHRAGFEFGVLSLRLSERANRLDDKCRSSFILANFILPWVQHVRTALPLNDAGHQGGLASGELQFAGYILIYKLMDQFYEGKPMAQVLSELPGFLVFNQKTNNQIATDIILGLELALSNLSGATRARGEFATEELSEAEYLAACESRGSQMASCYYQILKTQALYLHGDPAAALVASAAAGRLLPSIMGNIAVAEHAFYTALSLAAVCPAEPGEARSRAVEQLDEAVSRLERFAGSCPQNFAHMHALAAAEAARISGRVAALDLYDASVDTARANGFVQDEALANELAAKFWLERRKEKVAGAYVAEAYYGYQLWGARRKVAELEARHPWLLLQDTTASLRASITAPTTTGQRVSGSLDLSSVLKASQAISGEIVLEKLLTKLMEIVIENAGAQRGVLILEAKGELMVHVEARADVLGPEQAAVVTALWSMPVSRYAEIAEGVVRYVGRTRESVILGNAAHEGAFTEDAYVAASRPKSVLCTPLVHQGQLLGMLYIENNLTTGAFTPERLEVLRLLSSQIAISIQNARLYNEMEHKVEERTEELKRRNGDLQAAVLHLKTTQAQLIQSEKMASLGQLTAGIAHEIKNPLNFVNNFAELNAELATELATELEQRPDARLADVKDTFTYLKLNADKIREHGERADSIVRSMMQHASGAAGERQKADVNALVEEYVSLAYHGIRAQQRDLQVVIERDYDPSVGAVEMLPQEMGRVFVNLLNNAFYAVRDKQLKADGAYTPSVSVSTRRQGDHVRILVRDNGPGIPPAVSNKIFVPFFTTKPPGSGTGLGLSMSYDIVVHGHRGMLAVESAEGGGATFIVTLPV